ncbi:hypothetical protein BU204_05490 [Actinophytocola xanthii]|uniref:Nudix hydrolase domain-containing protein n=1 Tax=Actinophytocola xanthii TaxID=1912961 RepID=A0A1Q8CVP7_9PSEU|nr:hypothetical protein BU204_05490 [Actinophytocola xanthii]
MVLFTKRGDVLSVLAVERGKEPFRAALALPGGFVEPGEVPVSAAVRELAEETGLAIEATRLCQFGSYDRPGRDPRGHVISEAFHGYVPGAPDVVADDDAQAARWVPLGEFLSSAAVVAFDHQDIVAAAVLARFDWHYPRSVPGPRQP